MLVLLAELRRSPQLLRTPHRQPLHRRQINLLRIIKASLLFAISISINSVFISDLGECPSAKAAESFSQYADSSSGLSFMYPRGWGVQQNPEAEVLVKIEGTNGGAYGGDVQLSVHDADMDPARLAEVSEVTVFKTLPGYKKISSGPMHFGRLGQFSGVRYDIALKYGDLPVRQQYNFFRHNGKTYTVTFTAAEAAYAHLQPTFGQILASLAPGTSKRVTTASPTTHQSSARQVWKLAPYEQSIVGAKLWYPEGWRVSPDNHGSNPGLKITGKNSAGHDAELHLWTGERGEMSVEQAVEALEDEHLRPLPHYRKLNTTRRTFGSPPIEGIYQFATFTADGTPAKQMAFFFTRGEHLYVVALMAAAWTSDEMRDLFDRVAASVKITQ
jgi:hypothetical protein